MAKKRKSGVDVAPFVLGPRSAQVKRKATPAQWRKIVRTARGRGVTVEGLLSGQPPALQERSVRGIRREAAANIEQAYKPVFGELDARESKIKALAEKRTADAQRFQEWSAAKSAELNSQVQRGTEMFRQMQQAQQQSVKDSLMQISAGRPGVGGLNQGVLDAQRQGIIGAASADASYNTARAQQHEQTSAFLAANHRAYLAANAAREAEKFADEIKDVGDVRQKAILQKAADANRELSRLLDTEREKAQFRIQMDAAGAKLDLDVQQELNDVAKDKAAQREKNRAGRALRQHYASQDGIAEMRENRLQQEANDKASGKGGKKWEPDKTNTRKVVNAINDGATVVKQYYAKHGKGKGSEAVRYLKRTYGVSHEIAVAAVLRASNGKIPKELAKSFRALGVAIPSQWR